MKFFFISVFICWGLCGCSSSGFRAPVTDLTLHHSRQKKSIPSKPAVSPEKSNKYRVKAGDTLYSISWKHGLDIKRLAKRNHLQPPYLIYRGQILNLSEEKKRKYHSAVKKKVKSKPYSQKINKKSLIGCIGQKCVNNEKQVAHKERESQRQIKKSKVARGKISHWYWPAEGKLTESFSASKPGMKGISIANQRGTAIFAAASGQVVYAGSGLRGYGQLIIIKHNYDYLSAYAHNDKLLVHEHEQIKKGQKIALMGDSGSDSVFLHFEIRYRGKSVDPLRYLAKR